MRDNAKTRSQAGYRKQSVLIVPCLVLSLHFLYRFWTPHSFVQRSNVQNDVNFPSSTMPPMLMNCITRL